MVTVQIFNLSFDPVDHLLGIHDITINEIESGIEFILEIVLDKQGAIGEVDETDEALNKPCATIGLLAFSSISILSQASSFVDESPKTIAYNSLFKSLSLSTAYPPPKFIC